FQPRKIAIPVPVQDAKARTAMSTPPAMPASAPSSADATAVPRHDSVALAESLASAAEKSAKLMGEYAARNANGPRSVFADELGPRPAVMEVARQKLPQPGRMGR